MCAAFKHYFAAFATMYACPYCRGHLNQCVMHPGRLSATRSTAPPQPLSHSRALLPPHRYVIRNKETWAYPIEYTLLGWREGGEGGDDVATVTVADKLSTLTSGETLRLFVWKLHNAVNSSIARQVDPGRGPPPHVLPSTRVSHGRRTGVAPRG